MQYKCISKLKQKGLFNTVIEGDMISIERYSKLSPDEKTHFEKSYEDESWLDQFERNLRKEDKLENE